MALFVADAKVESTTILSNPYVNKFLGGMDHDSKLVLAVHTIFA